MDPSQKPKKPASRKRAPSPSPPSSTSSSSDAREDAPSIFKMITEQVIDPSCLVEYGAYGLLWDMGWLNLLPPWEGSASPDLVDTMYGCMSVRALSLNPSFSISCKGRIRLFGLVSPKFLVYLVQMKVIICSVLPLPKLSVLPLPNSYAALRLSGGKAIAFRSVLFIPPFAFSIEFSLLSYILARGNRT